jgi:hypothetical protein
MSPDVVAGRALDCSVDRTIRSGASPSLLAEHLGSGHNFGVKCGTHVVPTEDDRGIYGVGAPWGVIRSISAAVMIFTGFAMGSGLLCERLRVDQVRRFG